MRGRLQKLTPFAFLFPYIAVFGLFWAWPILYSFYLSFVNTRINPWTFQWTFNWGRLIEDPFFWTSFKNTLFILVVQVPLMLALATVMAVAINSPMLRLKGFFRYAFFAPLVVGAVAYSAIFRLLFNTKAGAVNGFFQSLGLPTFDWLFQGETAMAVLILAVTWRWTGYNAIILLAGLQNISEELYEAAQLDGASAWQQFWRITLPMLRPVLLLTLVLSVIGTMQLFTEPWLITNEGGPGTATKTLGVYLYEQGFRSFNFGYASSIAYTIALVASVFSLLQIRLFGRDNT